MVVLVFFQDGKDAGRRLAPLMPVDTGARTIQPSAS